MGITVNQTSKKESIQKKATIGLIIAAGLVVSPVIFLAIKGLIGLMIAAIIGLSVVTFSPWVAMKFANWRVRSIAAEAAENPIETMTNLLIEKRQAWKEFEQVVIKAVTAKKSFEQKCREFSARYPDRAAEFTNQLQAMNEVVEQKKRALQEAKLAIEKGEHTLQEMRAYWEMSQAAQAAHSAAGMDTGDLYARLKADTAVDSVFASMNTAFAQLEVAASVADLPNATVQQLNEPNLTIDVNTTTTQRVKV